MKTNFSLLLVTVFLGCLQARSQTSWQIAGNSNITTSNFLGTTNSQPVIFKTNNKERLRITSTGKVGIGLKNPPADAYLNIPVSGLSLTQSGSFLIGTMNGYNLGLE